MHEKIYTLLFLFNAYFVYADSYFFQLPLVKQSNYYSCGASAVQSILRYYGEDTYEIEVTPHLDTNEFYGTSCASLIHFFNQRGFETVGGEQMTIAWVKEFISQGKPVICLIKVHVEGTEYGHYVVASGYDEKNLYFMNPDYLGTYGSIPLSEFDSRWHHQFEHQSFVMEHWALAVSKGDPVFAPGSILYIP